MPKPTANAPKILGAAVGDFPIEDVGANIRDLYQVGCVGLGEEGPFHDVKGFQVSRLSQ